MLTHAAEALKILGGVGLFFSFTEVSEQATHTCTHTQSNSTNQLIPGCSFHPEMSMNFVRDDAFHKDLKFRKFIHFILTHFFVTLFSFVNEQDNDDLM